MEIDDQDNHPSTSNDIPTTNHCANVKYTPVTYLTPTHNNEEEFIPTPRGIHID